MVTASMQSISIMQGRSLHSGTKAMPSRHASSSACKGLLHELKESQADTIIEPFSSRIIIPTPPRPSLGKYKPSTLSLTLPPGGLHQAFGYSDLASVFSFHFTFCT